MERRPAWADDSPGSAGSTAASSPSGTEPATAKPTAVQGTKESGETGTTTTTATNGPVTKDNAVRSAPARAGTKETTDAVSRPASLAADPTERTGGGSPAPTLSVATSTAEPTAAPSQPEPTPPNAMNVVAGLVSGVVNAILSPFAASNTQGVPADAPSMWTLMAIARREFEPAFQSPPLANTAVNVQATSQALVTEAQAVENSLTYTAPPNLIDQLTLLGLRLVRRVSDVIGVDIAGNFGALMASADPPFFLTFGLNAHQTEFEASPGNVWKVWEFEPHNPTGKTVVAIHGGGYILQANLLN